MAYAGYLIKVGVTSPYEIPLSFIKAESYKATHLVQDLDSYRDANGLLHRNALSLIPDKVEFECVPLLTNAEMNAVISSIRSHFSNLNERKLSVNYYVPETDEYVTKNMYMPDIEFSMYYADGSLIKYNACRIAFIGYGD